jgi:general secretion pathway protein A
MMQQMGREILTVYMVNPFLTVPEFFELLIQGLRLGLPATASKTQVLNTLAGFLAHRHSRGLRTVLIADEAHGLSPVLLEEIRLLANLETNTEKLLQIILCGQPELRETLNQPNLRQLKQRISLRSTIKPLTPVEVIKYIRFRMKIAGAQRMDIFNAEALDLISSVSLGIPRVVNNICDNALLAGYADGKKTITRNIIEEVIDTLDLTTNETTTTDPMELSGWPSVRQMAVAEG